MKRAKRQAVVDIVRILLGDEGLKPLGRLGEDKRFQFSVCLMKDGRGRRFVKLARLDADQAVFHMIDPPDAVLAPGLVELVNKRDAVHLLPIESDRAAFVKLDFHIFRLIWRLDRIRCPGKGIRRRLVPGVF